MTYVNYPQNELRDKTRIAQIGLQGVLALPDDDPLSELIKYFVAATMKDCSVRDF